MTYLTPATSPSSGHAFRYASRSLGLIKSIGFFPLSTSRATRMAKSLSVVYLNPLFRYEMKIGDPGFFVALSFVFIISNLHDRVSCVNRKLHYSAFTPLHDSV